MNKKLNAAFILIKILGDAGMIYLCFLFAYWFRFNVSIVPVTKGVPPLEVYLRYMPVILMIFFASFKWSGFYSQRKVIYKTDEFLNIIKGTTVAIMLLGVATFIYREYEFSRLVIGYAYILIIISLYWQHYFLRILKRKIMPYSVGVIIIGGRKVKKTLLKNISKLREHKVYFMDEIDNTKIKHYIRIKHIEEIILADYSVKRSRILQLITLCEQTDVEFKMVPDMLELKMGEMSFDNYFGIPVLTLKHPLLEPSNYYTKRVFDIILSLIALIILLPLIIFTIVAIKLESRGPVIYFHLRKGFKGRVFSFFKFRSMVKDADDKLKDLMAHNERSGAAFKMNKDPRITKVGRFIRKYSLDELPQIFNVLKGDMSIVGPRPQVLWEAAQYSEEAKRRLNILPGITGLWQVSGRSDLSYDEMIRLDLYYLENWTAGLDVKILLKTLPVVILKKGAC